MEFGRKTNKDNSRQAGIDAGKPALATVYQGVAKTSAAFSANLRGATVILPLIFLFFVFLSEALSQNNPFEKMIGRKYVDYAYELHDKYEAFLKMDTLEKQEEVIDQLKEVAKETKKTEWNLYVEYFKLGLKIKTSGHPESLLQKQLKLMKKAEHKGVMQIELCVRYDIIANYYLSKNYDPALKYCNMQEQRLQKVSADDIPLKIIYASQIADIYFMFKDYKRSLSINKELLKEEETIYTQLYRQSVLNTIGLCYRHGFNDYDRSDSCFYAILRTKYIKSSDEEARSLWDGIAEINLGRNMFLRGDYDKALPHLKDGLEKVLQYDDYDYGSRAATTMALIYLEKENLTFAKRYIDMAKEFYEISPYEHFNVLSSIYKALSMYNALIGNAELSLSYMDSMQIYDKEHETQFSPLRLTYAKNDQLDREDIQKMSRTTKFVIIISSFLAGIFAVLGVILYQRKQHLIKERMQQWKERRQQRQEKREQAHIMGAELFEDDSSDVPESPRVPASPASEEDLQVMDKIERLMVEKKMWKNHTLSIDMLAQELNVKRHYLSKVLNDYTGKNFNTFVNEYRVEAATLLLQSDEAKVYSIDHIAITSGFNDRVTFYRAFKKINHVSPSDFRKTENNE